MFRFLQANLGTSLLGTKPAALKAAALFFCLLPSTEARPPALEPNLTTELVKEGSDLLLTESQTLKSEAMAHFSAGLSHQLNGRAEQAFEEFYKAGLADPSNDKLILDVSRRLIQQKDLDRAATLLDKAAERSDASIEILMIQGFIANLQGKSDKAIKANRKALELSPDELLPYQNLIRALIATGATDEIKELIKKVRDQHSDNAAFLSSFVHNLLELPAQEQVKIKDLGELVTPLLNQAEQLKPETPVRELIAFNLRRLGEYEEAIAIYEDLIKDDPKGASLKVRLAEALYQKGDLEKAAKYFSEYVVDRPNAVQVYLTLSQIYIQLKKYEQAEEAYEKAILFKPDFEGVYYELARLKTYLDKPNEALEVIEKARDKFKVSFLMEYTAALAWRRQDEMTKALEFYTKAELIAKTSDPEQLDEEFYHELGSAHERNKDYELAEKYFRICLKKDPDHAETLNYLGYMWAERGENLKEAKEMISKALKLQPKNAAFLDSMAWVLYQLGDAKAALPYQIKAMENLEEPDPILYEHLGDIYSKLKKKRKAAEYWKKSLKLEESESLKKKLNALEAGSKPKDSPEKE